MDHDSQFLFDWKPEARQRPQLGSRQSHRQIHFHLLNIKAKNHTLFSAGHDYQGSANHRSLQALTLQTCREWLYFQGD
jgi:hypothetical protein